MLFSGSSPSSLLPTSESRTFSLPHGSPREFETRPSAASLPNILNSPSSPVPSNTGLGGLQVLVQAATEERRRLSGELGSDPLSSRADSSPRLSRSPVLERAPVQPPMPVKVHTKPLSPLVVRTSSGGRRNILNDDDHISPSHTRDLDGEPPRKRRKSSDAPSAHPSPVAIQQPVGPPRDVAELISTSEVAHVLSSAIKEEESGPLVDDDLRTTSIPVAPHEVGRSASDTEAPSVPPVVSRKSPDETVEEQILDAVDVSTARAHEKDKGREKEERAREKEKRKREQKTKEKRASEQKHGSGSVARETGGRPRDQDAHEWLLEHYASASPPVHPAPSSSDSKTAGSPLVTAPLIHASRGAKAEDGNCGRHHSDEPGTARPSKVTKKARTTPLAMLEEELNGVLPISHTAASSIEDDLVHDLAPPAIVSSVGGGLADDNDMDVDNELLSLVDDAPPVHHSSRLKPPNVRKLDVHARTKSSQPGSERGSMPPPASPIKDGGKVHPAKAGDSSGTAGAVAGHKKKDATHKVSCYVRFAS